jgi:hypothetical protein
MQIRRVSHTEARERCGIRYKSDHLEGLAFPYLNPDNPSGRVDAERGDVPEIAELTFPVNESVKAILKERVTHNQSVGAVEHERRRT